VTRLHDYDSRDENEWTSSSRTVPIVASRGQTPRIHDYGEALHVPRNASRIVSMNSDTCVFDKQSRRTTWYVPAIHFTYYSVEDCRGGNAGL